MASAPTHALTETAASGVPAMFVQATADTLRLDDGALPTRAPNDLSEAARLAEERVFNAVAFGDPG